jgi:hypothetical protein
MKGRSVWQRLKQSSSVKGWYYQSFPLEETRWIEEARLKIGALTQALKIHRANSSAAPRASPVFD